MFCAYSLCRRSKWRIVLNNLVQGILSPWISRAVLVREARVICTLIMHLHGSLKKFST